MNMNVSSKTIKNNVSIERKYTCKNQGGDEISPDISWNKVPGAKSYALLVFDPDAPSGTWIHWLISYIPPKITKIPSMPVTNNNILEVYGEKLRQGMNSWGRYGYGGPCPPPGKQHRYFFAIYALDIILDGDRNAEKFVQQIKGHVIGTGHIIGLYKHT